MSTKKFCPATNCTARQNPISPRLELQFEGQIKEPCWTHCAWLEYEKQVKRI